MLTPELPSRLVMRLQLASNANCDRDHTNLRTRVHLIRPSPVSRRLCAAHGGYSIVKRLARPASCISAATQFSSSTGVGAFVAHMALMMDRNSPSMLL